MRKLLWLSVIILPIIVFGILILINKPTTPKNSNAQEPSPSPTTQNQENQTVQINGLTFAWHKINNIDNLKLIPNFSQKNTSQEIINTNNCSFIVNASLYSKDFNPIGLFISNAVQVSGFQENNLLDSILSINDMATPRITTNVPSDHLQIAVQTGPLIKQNGEFQSLQIQNDYQARRVLAAVTGENNLFFITIYDKTSQFSGPLLADVPDLLKQFENKTNITFADAINLDGGAASVFIDQNTNLTEASPVGAFFCQQ